MSLFRQTATTASTNWYLDSQNNEYCMKQMEISHLHELLVRWLSLWEHEGEDDDRWWQRQSVSVSSSLSSCMAYSCGCQTLCQGTQIQTIYILVRKIIGLQDYTGIALVTLTCFIPEAAPQSVILCILSYIARTWQGVCNITEPRLLGYKFQLNNLEIHFILTANGL